MSRWAIVILAMLVATIFAGCTQADPPVVEQENPALPTLAIEVIFLGDELIEASASFSDQAQVDVIHWNWGDGTSATGMPARHEYRNRNTVTIQATASHPTYGALVGKTQISFEGEAPTATPQDPTTSSSSTSSGEENTSSSSSSSTPPVPLTFGPKVVVGIPDSGINVYHEVYYRPGRTEHPCTYIKDFPCDIPSVNFSVGKYQTWSEAYNADKEIWSKMSQKKWYWIPETVFVAVRCEGTTTATDTSSVNVCLIDDTSMHGTGTTSSVLSENPDAYMVFVEGNSGGASIIHNSGLPVDIISYSWGFYTPLAGGPLLATAYRPFFVAASGNEGAFPVALDSPKSHSSVITVGGADGASKTEPGYSSWKTADYVSEYCRPTAQTNSIHEMRPSYCGTSFSAPTFAGALSLAILQVRKMSGYDGTIENGVVDPILGLTKDDFREALNHTASYAPNSPFGNDPELAPLILPQYQWGWGYVARNEIPAMLGCLIDGVCPTRPADVVAYMEAVWLVRQVNSGEIVGL